MCLLLLFVGNVYCLTAVGGVVVVCIVDGQSMLFV